MNDALATDSVSEFAAMARNANAGTGCLQYSFAKTKDRAILIYAAKGISDFDLVRMLVRQLAGDDE